MKKILMSISAIMILLSPFVGQASAAEPKVTWKGNEIRVNQLGVVHFVKDVKTYKRNSAGEIISVERGKAGLAYRVYSIVQKGNTTVYNIGANIQVQQTNLVNYEGVPFAVREKFFVMHGIKGDFGFIQYPEFIGFPTSEILNKNIQNLVDGLSPTYVRDFPAVYVGFDKKEGKIVQMHFEYSYEVDWNPIYYDFLVNTATGEVTSKGLRGGGPVW